MDVEEIRRLNSMTQEFYSEVADSFSDTRQCPWSGWERIAEYLQGHDSQIPADEHPACDANAIRLLDLGSGNMRFERYLESMLPSLGFPGIDATMVDTCDFPDDGFPGTHIKRDIVESILSASDKPDGQFDLVVAFGLFHHVPTSSLRKRLLHSMIESATPGGIVAVSLWQPLGDERIARKAAADTERGTEQIGFSSLERNDLLLGWQDRNDVFRYCHHFDGEDIEELIDNAKRSGARLLDSFSPDSGSDRLNHYLVFAV